MEHAEASSVERDVKADVQPEYTRASNKLYF